MVEIYLEEEKVFPPGVHNYFSVELAGFLFSSVIMSKKILLFFMS